MIQCPNCHSVDSGEECEQDVHTNRPITIIYCKVCGLTLDILEGW